MFIYFDIKMMRVCCIATIDGCSEHKIQLVIGFGTLQKVWLAWLSLVANGTQTFINW